MQFEGDIEEAVKDAMMTYAIRKSKETGKEILYGIIAREDSRRLRVRYEGHFTEENLPDRKLVTIETVPTPELGATTPPASTEN